METRLEFPNPLNDEIFKWRKPDHTQILVWVLALGTRISSGSLLFLDNDNN